MRGKRILLIVGGGIAAHKACELIRLIRKAGGTVRCVLTKSGAEFVTPMTLAALSEQPVHTTLLLATDKPVLAAPAMNVRMWQHEATKRNVARLRADGVAILEPDEGEMACGEYGPGRLPEPVAIAAAIGRA